MRLGLWNRLAIVAIILTVLIAPITIMVLMFGDYSDSVGTSYELCISVASDGPVDQMSAAIEQCNDRMSVGYKDASNTAYSWATWFQLAGGTLIVCAVLYGVIWAASATARWVWRGRQHSA